MSYEKTSIVRANLITAGVLLALWMVADLAYVSTGQRYIRWQNLLPYFVVIPAISFFLVTWFRSSDRRRGTRLLYAFAAATFMTVFWLVASHVVMFYFHPFIGGHF